MCFRIVYLARLNKTKTEYSGILFIHFPFPEGLVHSWSAESAKGSQVASKANADLHVVDRPTQLICISDIYLLSADKYQRHSKANADLNEERNEFKTLMSQFFLSLQLCDVEKYQ